MQRPAVVGPASFVCDGQFHFYSSPNGTGNNYLFGISAVSANDIWAVGNQTNSSGFDRTLAEHWNGTSWTKIATVNTGSRHNDLFGVSAVSSNDVWAVGAYQIDSLNHAATIAQHWNGTSWSKVTTQNPTSAAYLFAVDAVSTNSVWAVGTVLDSSGEFVPMVQHFNGTSWSYTLPPGIVQGPNELFAVSALTDTDVWAVGSF